MRSWKALYVHDMRLSSAKRGGLPRLARRAPPARAGRGCRAGRALKACGWGGRMGTLERRPRRTLNGVATPQSASRRERYPPRRGPRLAARRGHGPDALRALRLPRDPRPDLRGDRALRPRHGRGHGRRREGDVPRRRPAARPARGVGRLERERAQGGRGARARARGADPGPGPGGRGLLAPAGVHGGNRPRLPRARPRPEQGLPQGVFARAAVPLRAAAEGPAPPVPPDQRRGARRERPADRRRGDRARARHRDGARHPGLPGAAQLDRPRGPGVPRALPRAAARAPAAAARRAVRPLLQALRSQHLPRARLQAVRRQDGGPAAHGRAPLRGLRRALRDRPGGARASRDRGRRGRAPRPRLRLLHAHRLRVPLRPARGAGRDRGRRPLRPADPGHGRPGPRGVRVRARGRAPPHRHGDARARARRRPPRHRLRRGLSGGGRPRRRPRPRPAPARGRGRNGSRPRGSKLEGADADGEQRGLPVRRNPGRR